MTIEVFFNDPERVKSLKQLETEVGEWAFGVFPNEFYSVVRHVDDEIHEVSVGDTFPDRKNYREEICDIILILFHWSKLKGKSLVDSCAEFVAYNAKPHDVKALPWLFYYAAKLVASQEDFGHARCVMLAAIDAYLQDGDEELLVALNEKFLRAHRRSYAVDGRGVAHHTTA